MIKLPVYEKCRVCLGKGEIEIEEPIVDASRDQIITYKKRCIECQGQGKIKTDYFIEIEFPDFLAK